MSKIPDNNNLLEADDAVENYLESLLQEATDSSPAQQSVTVKDNVVLLPDFDLEEPATAPVETSEARVQPEPTPEVTQPVASTEHDFPLQCLMFEVAGIKLAIPLIELGSVVPWPETLTRIPSAGDWSLGVIRHRERQVKVVDTAQLLEIRGSDLNQSGTSSRHVLVFGDSGWGLSCDALGDVVGLEQDEVQWHPEMGDGLSQGTIRDSLARLLSPQRIIAKLEQQAQ